MKTIYKIIAVIRNLFKKDHCCKECEHGNTCESEIKEEWTAMDKMEISNKGFIRKKADA